MEKKILLAVDGSIHSRHAVHYAVRMSSVVRDFTCTLLHIQPCLSQFLLDEARTDFKAKAELKKVIRRNAEAETGTDIEFGEFLKYIDFLKAVGWID